MLNTSSYKNTTVHWSKSQGEIIQLLEKEGVEETRFTNLSYETMKRAGMQVEDNTVAIMVEFFKITQLSNGVSGNIPIRIIIPNVPNDEQSKNQVYRIFKWYLKTKFEAVNSGLLEFEQEFLPHIAIGKGSFAGNVWNAFKEKVLPQIMSGENADISLIEAPKSENDLI